MMIDPPIDKLAEKTEGNKFILSVIVSKRAKKINAGEKPLVEAFDKEKPVSIAAREVFEDKITYSKKSK